VKKLINAPDKVVGEALAGMAAAHGHATTSKADCVPCCTGPVS
jgi:dihydroxyacetone kinase